MNTNSPEPKEGIEKKLDWATKVAPFLIPAIGVLFSLGGEAVYYWSSLVLIVLTAGGSLLLYFKPSLFERNSAVVGADGNPIPVAPRAGYWKWCLLCFATVALQFLVVWLIYWDCFFWLAKIEDFQGSKIYGSRGSGMFFVGGRVEVSFGDQREIGYSSAFLKVVKSPSIRKIRIEKVRFSSEPMPEHFRINHVIETLPANAIESNRYFVDLSKDTEVFEAIPLTTKGEIADHMVFFDEKIPFGKLHFDFEGGKGLYKVKASLTIKDEYGARTQDIIFPNAIYLFNSVGESEKAAKNGGPDRSGKKKLNPARPPSAKISALLNEPMKYYGRRIDVEGVVREVARTNPGKRAYLKFVIKDRTGELTVASFGENKDLMDLQIGDEIQRSGIFEREIDPMAELGKKNLDEFNKHVFMPLKNALRDSGPAGYQQFK